MAASLEEVGFIHCSSAELVLRVANAFYRDLEDPVVLCIAPERLSANVRWESPEVGNQFASERFPHVYGAINLDAVVETRGLARGTDGLFTGF